MKRKRHKQLSPKQFQEVQERNWKPVRLVGDAIPDFLKGLSTGVVHSVYASGTAISNHLYDEPLVLGNHIGGIEVYRNAPDDPVNFNKDVYAVFVNKPEIAGNDLMLIVIGPLKKDKEHWMDEIPERLDGVEVLLPPDDGN